MDHSRSVAAAHPGGKFRKGHLQLFHFFSSHYPLIPRAGATRIVFLGKKPSPSIFLVGRGRTEKDRESVAKSSAEILFSNLGEGREDDDGAKMSLRATLLFF